MRILHYFLGLPPFRSGGVTAYFSSLILAHRRLYGENNVMILTVSSNLFSIKTKLRNYQDLHFELVNGPYMPLLNGVKYPHRLFDYNLKDDVIKEFKELLFDFKPNIIHVHTLMGLPKELLQIAKDLGILIVMTTHDFYGICPKVNLINYKGYICDNPIHDCFNCNYLAPSPLKLKLFNMPIVHKYKTTLLKILARQREGYDLTNNISISLFNSLLLKLSI